MRFEILELNVEVLVIYQTTRRRMLEDDSRNISHR